jgi:hypothetical protein
VCLPFASGQDARDARTILESAIQVAHSGPSYRAEFNGTVEDVAPGYQVKTDVSGSILSVPPENFRANEKIGSQDLLLVRDGEDLWVHAASVKRYSRVPYSIFSSSSDRFILFNVVLNKVNSAELE